MVCTRFEENEEREKVLLSHLQDSSVGHFFLKLLVHRVSLISVDSFNHISYFCQLCCVLKVFQHTKMSIPAMENTTQHFRLPADCMKRIAVSAELVVILSPYTNFCFAQHSERWKPRTKQVPFIQISAYTPRMYAYISCMLMVANVTRDMNPKLTCPFSSVKITTVLYLAIRFANTHFVKMPTHDVDPFGITGNEMGRQCGENKKGRMRKRRHEKDSTHDFNRDGGWEDQQ